MDSKSWSLGAKETVWFLLRFLLAVFMTSNSSHGKAALGFVLLYTFYLCENSSYGPCPFIPTLMTTAESHESSDFSHKFPKWAAPSITIFRHLNKQHSFQMDQATLTDRNLELCVRYQAVS